ncbi:MAG: NUDIX hydrolase [Alphaproteobacteria bacterium]|nr:NUDIX hydrolase [Alphaproteobacteria bacterium]
MTRTYPTRPMAGVGVVVFKEDAVLLIRRGKPPNRGAISLPGGAQELGETVRETAVREVLEETGVTAQITDLVDAVDAIRKDAEGRILYHYTLIDFAADWVSGEPTPGSDADEAFWRPLDRLDELMLWAETKRVIRLADAIRRR